MEQALPKIRAAGLGVAAISYDTTSVLKQFAARSAITFPLLSDPDSAVIREYGILNQTVDRDTPFYGIPHPGTYLVDPRGIITSKFFEEDYRVRDTAASILLRQFGVTAAAHQAAHGRHVELTAAASDGEARPGQRVTLSLEVVPGNDIHVYAPGVQGYIPVSLAFAKTPAFREDPPIVPPSKSMNLAAIHETVPVYDAPFRMLETVTLAAANTLEPLLDANRDLTIRADFRYQACDRKECFVPETVPLRWTLHVQPFDRQRVPEELRRK